MFDAITLRIWLFDGMSKPLVGSSIRSRRVFVARAKLINAFFFCPIDNSLRRRLLSISKSRRQLLRISLEKRG